MSVELSPEQRGALQPERFPERELFTSTLVGFVGHLEKEEARLKSLTGRERLYYASRLQKGLWGRIHNFRPEEAKIFEGILDLYLLKHDFLPRPREAGFIKSGGFKESRLVEVAGPIGTGKSTLMLALKRELANSKTNGQLVEEDFKGNVFWWLQNNPDFMLRSQLTFLLSSINTGLDAGYHPGIYMRDSSPFSDIYEFMETYRQTGRVNQEEYTTYHRVVELFKDVIRKPDLLIFFSVKDDNAELLKACLEQRLEDQPERAVFEKNITVEELKIAIGLNHRARKILEEEWGIEILPLEVDPQEFFDSRRLRYAHTYAVRSRLGLLKDLLQIIPEKVADKTVQIFAKVLTPQVVVVHSESMFTGKTTAEYMISQKVGIENVLGFQPRAAIRYGEEQETNIMTRDRRKIEAHTIESNDLKDIIKFIDKNSISSKEKRYILIDEIRSFRQNSPEEAIAVLEALREMGFHVVIDGIDYTFQEKPFTFMHQLIENAFKDRDWHEIRMSTRCKYCGKIAKGTRRIKVGTGEIARYSDDTFLAGDSNYEPVCCEEDKSCLGQPVDFERKPLPTRVER